MREEDDEPAVVTANDIVVEDLPVENCGPLCHSSSLPSLKGQSGNRGGWVFPFFQNLGDELRENSLSG